jgi:thymidylate synthase (FAD)
MNKAKIIAMTRPFEKVTISEGKYGRADEERNMSAEEFIAYTARVSNPGNQNNTLTAPKLLTYLIKNKHWSPFEMVHVTMEINTTRDIAHQIVRHRSFSFQEFSQRYADPTKDMGFTRSEARLQDAKNRQNSIETNDQSLENNWFGYQENARNSAICAYEWAVENGIAKEVARKVLPEGLTNTRLYMSGSLRSWIHYIDVRATKGTQKEHREVALEAQKEILEKFPSLKDYWFPTIDEYEDDLKWFENKLARATNDISRQKYQSMISILKAWKADADILIEKRTTTVPFEEVIKQPWIDDEPKIEVKKTPWWDFWS